MSIKYQIMKNKLIESRVLTLSTGLCLVAILMLSSCKKSVLTPDNGVATELNAMDIMAPAAQGNYEANKVIVKFRKEMNEATLGPVLMKIGGKVNEHVHTGSMKKAGDRNGVYLLDVPMAAFEAIQKLKGMPEVEFAEPNFIYTHNATSNDPYYTGNKLWGMYSSTSSPSNNYGCAATTAWANGHTGSSEVYVAIIDEGVMNSHEDLTANCWVNPNDAVDGIDNDGNGYIDDKWGWDFAGNDNTTYDGASDDHATHVAGTIGGVGGNGKGVVGVCWTVKMISCKFLGQRGGTTINAIKAVDYVTDLKSRAGINIVATNNSWGGGGYSQALKDAIDRAAAGDILFIAAAGNSGTNNDASPSYPASYTSDNIIAVAAISSTGGLASFSQYGATSVDIGAPGVGINSSIPATKKGASSYASYNGTSMATPHVTGAAALYASTNGVMSYTALKAAILGAAVPLPSLSGKCATGGMLNVSTF